MTRAHPTLAPRQLRAEPFPLSIEPMLAVPGSLPPDPDNWAFEYKWDGVRCMTFWDGRQLKLLSRNHNLITHRYPELSGLGRALGRRAVVLDGEIVALDAAGQPSFGRLQHRMHVNAPSARLVDSIPVWYVVFDILYADGRSTMDLPYVDRRDVLEEVTLVGDHWQVSPYHVGDGEAMLEAAKGNAMEGVVAKALDSGYEPGRRSPQWMKIKVVFGQEFVIGGWTPEVGARQERVGALLVGYYDHAGAAGQKLRYAGRVGTGFTDDAHAQLVKALKRLGVKENPFADPLPRGETHFVKPELVAEVQYRRWPAGSPIHQSSFKGLRDDKRPQDVVRESGGAL